MLLFGQTISLWKAVATLAIAFLVQGFYKLCRARAKFWALQREHGIATLPHSFLFGHLVEIGKVLASEAPEAHQQLSMWLLLEKNPHMWKQGFFYLDLWPVQYPMIVCYNPDLVSQFTQQESQPKSVILTVQFRRLTGGRDLLSTEGPHWKTWRSNFNPGFSARNILSLVPSFIEEILVFRSIFNDAAESGKVLKMSDPASKLAFDVIGNAVLGGRLHSLTTEESFYKTFLAHLGWNYADWGLHNLPKVLNPTRPFFTRYYDRKINDELMSYIDQELDDQAHREGPKTVLNLAIKAYLKQAPPGTAPARSVADLEPSFLSDVISHLRIFLLAGFDTTSFVLCIIFWSLQQNPQCLAKARAEHDEILGSDAGLAAQRIRDDPTLLNQLPYTSAVIKEAMRVQPVTGTVRGGEPGFVLTHPITHQPLPTEGFVLYSSPHAMHRHPDFWPRRLEFLPERWLVPEGHELHPVRNTWRPFEMGPRNCIGQELVQTELRAVMALTLREFDLVPQYDPDGPKLYGDLAYQVPAEVTTRPKDGLPVKVVRRVMA